MKLNLKIQLFIVPSLIPTRRKPRDEANPAKGRTNHKFEPKDTTWHKPVVDSL